MKRVIIICEGETEKEFCNKILGPYYMNKNIHIQSPLIKKSMGGIVKWSELRKQIILHLRGDTSAYTTTFIDYYGIYNKHKFPSWEKSLLIKEKYERIDFLQTAMLNDIDEPLRKRFLPYFQLHEFEGLLFNDLNIFHEQIPNNELVGLKELESVFEEFSNPELINDSTETSPSHRLERIILGYNKLVYGNILAEAIGLEKMRAKSPGFNNWLDNIEKIN